MELEFCPHECSVASNAKHMSSTTTVWLQVSYEQAAIVQTVVTNNWGWDFVCPFETKQSQQPKTASDSVALQKTVLTQRNDRETKQIRRSVSQNKSDAEQLYLAGVSWSATHACVHCMGVICTHVHSRAIAEHTLSLNITCNV